MPVRLNAASRLLFIGDSITDCYWRDDEMESIGNGYVRMIRDYLTVDHPTAAPKVLNRGISGNKMPDLQKRWQRDVIENTPDLLSIFIGINDVWHGLPPRNAGCGIDEYTAGYREILTQTRQALPECQLILCEPSVLWLEDPPDANQRLRPYIDAVYAVADEFDAAAVVPLHGAFEAARQGRPDIPWTTDGVHPTSYGHALIAREWLAACGLA